MKAACLLALVVALSVSPQQTSAPNKAPTKDSCRVELVLMSKASKGNEKEFLTKFPGPQIYAALQRMQKCRQLDPEMGMAYADGVTTHMSELFVRQADFIGRHNLTDLYAKEDAEGLR